MFVRRTPACRASDVEPSLRLRRSSAKRARLFSAGMSRERTRTQRLARSALRRQQHVEDQTAAVVGVIPPVGADAQVRKVPPPELDNLVSLDLQIDIQGFAFDFVVRVVGRREEDTLVHAGSGGVGDSRRSGTIHTRADGRSGRTVRPSGCSPGPRARCR